MHECCGKGCCQSSEDISIGGMVDGEFILVCDGDDWKEDKIVESGGSIAEFENMGQQ